MFQKLSIKKNLLKQFDFSIIVTVIFLVIFSLTNVFSATHMKSGFRYFNLQLMWIVISSIVVYLMLSTDYIIIANYSKLIYWLSIGILLFNDITSKAVKGAASWIKIGGIAIEPGEFVKIGLLLMLSKYIYDMKGSINSSKNLFICSVYAIIPMFLILIQPNIGMTLICLFITLGVLYIAGLNYKYILSCFASITALSMLCWNSGVMKAYQKDRILSFLNPQKYQSDFGFQLIQSQIAIGSGGLIGEGFLKGTQVAGGYVPEVHTDFIFAVIGEEWGLLGSIVLILLYSILIYRIINTAKNSKDILGSLICVGVASSLLFSILQNIGMTIGIMPIAGIPLPFMSYGGSSILTNFISIGLVLNIGMRRNKINF